jgi:hypothetical protein
MNLVSLKLCDTLDIAAIIQSKLKLNKKTSDICGAIHEAVQLTHLKLCSPILNIHTKILNISDEADDIHYGMDKPYFQTMMQIDVQRFQQIFERIMSMVSTLSGVDNVEVTSWAKDIHLQLFLVCEFQVKEARDLAKISKHEIYERLNQRGLQICSNLIKSMEGSLFTSLEECTFKVTLTLPVSGKRLKDNDQALSPNNKQLYFLWRPALNRIQPSRNNNEIKPLNRLNSINLVMEDQIGSVWSLQSLPCPKYVKNLQELQPLGTNQQLQVASSNHFRSSTLQTILNNLQRRGSSENTNNCQNLQSIPNLGSKMSISNIQ